MCKIFLFYFVLFYFIAHVSAPSIRIHVDASLVIGGAWHQLSHTVQWPAKKNNNLRWNGTAWKNVPYVGHNIRLILRYTTLVTRSSSLTQGWVLSAGSRSSMHKKKQKCDLDLWPMTLKFKKRFYTVVEVHVHAKFRQAKCSGSWVINRAIDFGQLWTLIANTSGTDQTIYKRKTALATTIFPRSMKTIMWTLVH